ncbi:Pyrrolidone-carboxylate peptidase-like protein [Quillaja saponaria]|uniref:Pyrrolidone-carboxylate peptidase-like protein n=1 Tax=Quillaja saponaria TaxID=32244 RepID=A0AAD7L8N1_QUISA|nr:Pyrrolidone-carboxylate peptidase-like protein [Quillaja saponaria]
MSKARKWDLKGQKLLLCMCYTWEFHYSKTNAVSNEQVVWLHLGVNSGVHKFAIERQAANEATFLCPHELGWQPQQVPKVPEDGVTSRTREVVLFAIMFTTIPFD